MIDDPSEPTLDEALALVIRRALGASSWLPKATLRAQVVTRMSTMTALQLYLVAEVARVLVGDRIDVAAPSAIPPGE